MPAIRNLLDLSTAHLPEDIADTLDRVPGVTAHSTTYGWLLWVPDEPDHHVTETGEAICDVVLTIWRYARHLDCDFVLLDADGEVIDALPSWDW